MDSLLKIKGKRDFLFCYRDEDILLKILQGTYELPVYGELPPKFHPIFSLEGKSYGWLFLFMRMSQSQTKNYTATKGGAI